MTTPGIDFFVLVGGMWRNQCENNSFLLSHSLVRKGNKLKDVGDNQSEALAGRRWRTDDFITSIMNEILRPLEFPCVEKDAKLCYTEGFDPLRDVAQMKHVFAHLFQLLSFH